ncbi:MAG: hypothetical protein K5663_08160 [Clostridiales bacterium]|nr:hypothetical protein [Clostridiales bacterium]
MKRRSACAFGLHFDFHASPGPDSPSIGETLKEEDIREICRLLRPDYLQIDCKGHPGWASYPTLTGNAMPSIKRDTLELWRRVTKSEGVGLFMHYSGVFDRKYCSEHPEDAVMRPDGSRSTDITRTFGLKYADRVLIPQLKELAGRYGVDGVWVDGECWATDLDFDPETLEAFERECGISLGGALPSDPASMEYRLFREFCRECFRRYVRHYTNEVHREYPDFQIISNWLCSDYMPEPVPEGIDCLSGDFSPWSSVNSARTAARTLASQGRGWDLMAWNFRVSRTGATQGRFVKEPCQLMQEAACVTSLGGGFQDYIPQYPDGSPRMWQIRRLKPLADMIRVRQEYCFGGKVVPQATVLLSRYDRYLEGDKLFSRSGSEKVTGLVSLLCDIGRSVSIVSEHTLSHPEKWGVILVPELVEGLEHETLDLLLDYARQGGSLLVNGVNACKMLEEAGIDIHVSKRTDELICFSCDGECYGSVYGSSRLSSSACRVFAESCLDPRRKHDPFALILPYGNGRIACVGADIGSAYILGRQEAHKRLMRKLLDELYTPLCEVVSCEGILEKTELFKDGRLLIQLVNMNGPHSDLSVPSFSEIPPCRDVVLRLRLKGEVKAVLRPIGESLTAEPTSDGVLIRVDRVECHEIIEIPLDKEFENEHFAE